MDESEHDNPQFKRRSKKKAPKAALLRDVLPVLIQKGEVHSTDVSAEFRNKYGGDAFPYTCNALCDEISTFISDCEPLGLPIPRPQKLRGSLRLPTRPFVDELKKDVSTRKWLAKEVVHDPELMPREGSILIGNGSTMYWLAQELLDEFLHRPEYNLSISTYSFEVMALFYFCAPHKFGRNSQLYFKGCQVEWSAGTVDLHKQLANPDTAFISVHAIKGNGTFNTKELATLAITKEALDRATRIVVIADQSKFHASAADGGDIHIQDIASKKPVFLVTDKLPDNVSMPAGIKVIEKPNSSIPPHHLAHRTQFQGLQSDSADSTE